MQSREFILKITRIFFSKLNRQRAIRLLWIRKYAALIIQKVARGRFSRSYCGTEHITLNA